MFWCLLPSDSETQRGSRVSFLDVRVEGDNSSQELRTPKTQLSLSQHLLLS